MPEHDGSVCLGLVFYVLANNNPIDPVVKGSLLSFHRV